MSKPSSAIATRNDNGASAVEYALLVAAIAALITGVVFALGGFIKTALSSTCSHISSGDSIATRCS